MIQWCDIHCLAVLLAVSIISICHVLPHHFLQLEETFLTQLEVVIKKEKVIELTIDEGWYTQEEMTSELGWSKKLCCTIVSFCQVFAFFK